MTSSEEYLARLGFDTSDSRKAAEQMVTTLGHLGSQFDDLSKKSDKASRALMAPGQAATQSAKQVETASKSLTAYDQITRRLMTNNSRQNLGFNLSSISQNELNGYAEFSAGLDTAARKQKELTDQQSKASQQNALYNQYLYDQARAQDVAAAATQRQAQQQLPRLRYALYDVSNATLLVSAGLVAAGVAVEGTAIQYERAFADVERTSKDLSQVDLGHLRDQLVGLTSEIPSSFGEIAQIATLGNQLNIPDKALTSFTKTVAEFSATTDVSVEASATAFGRLGEVLGTTDYRGIGDDIAYLGVNAVATESQIIKVAQNIAVSTNMAKFGTEATLALATALASLGVAPEQARGSILRVFGQINAAISQGGTKLNDLAAISGKSSAQFVQDWQTDAPAAFRAFLGGLSRSGDVQSSLAAINVTATRDIQTIGLLSQNLNVLDQANSDVTQSNGYLEKSFGVIVNTVSSKLQILQNNVQRIFDTIGSQASGPFASALDIINTGLEKLDQILSNPLAAGGVAITGTIVTLLGVLGIASAAALRFAATVLAVKTASIEAGVNQGVLATTLDILTGRFGKAAAGAAALTAAEGELAIAGTAATASQNGLNATGAAADGAAGKASKLSGVLGKAGLIGSMLALIPLIPALVTGFQDWVNEIKGTSAGVDELTTKIQGLNNQASKTASQGDLRKLLSNAGDNSVSYGSNFGSNTPKSITGPQAYFNKYTTGQTTPGMDVSFLEGGGQINQVEGQAEQAIKSYDAALAQLANSGNLAAVQAGLRLYHEEMSKANLSNEQADQLLPQTAQALGITAGASLDAGAAAKDQADGTDEAAQAFKEYIDAAYGATNAQYQLSNDLSALGEAFYNNGADVASNGQEIQKVIQDIYDSSGGGAQAAAQLQGFFDALVQGGYASADQLMQLQLVISQLTGGKGIQGATFSLAGFNQGLNKAAQSAAKAGGAAGGAAKQIRTLVDYGNDLKQVFSRAFDIRFGGGIAADQIASGWNSIKQAIADTNQQIKEYQATIAQLQSDNAQQKYFLSVAENYGDELRAAEIRAQIAKNNADLDKTTQDLTLAQQKNSKTLDGNSQAAIDNRAELSGLVKNYEDYIAQLAASGMSQADLQAKTAQLRQEFIQQALQLGYSTNQVYAYASAFDDMTLAIQRVPKNITVTANTNPALQALNELAAKAQQLSNTTYGGPSFSGAALEKSARGAKLQAQLVSLNMALNDASGAGDRASVARIQQSIASIANQLASGSYKTGSQGLTPGGINDIAGVVHGREFVLNATGAQMLPIDMLNGMNKGIPPQLPFLYNTAKGANGSDAQVPLLQQAVSLLYTIAQNSGVEITGDALTTAANLGNVTNSRKGRG